MASFMLVEESLRLFQDATNTIFTPLNLSWEFFWIFLKLFLGRFDPEMTITCDHHFLFSLVILLGFTYVREVDDWRNGVVT
jgi:hypothetical protein